MNGTYFREPTGALGSTEAVDNSEPDGSVFVLTQEPISILVG